MITLLLQALTVALVQRFPSITVFINGLLVLIGIQLVLQALGIDFEEEFNAFVLLAILAVVIYIWYTNRQVSKR